MENSFRSDFYISYNNLKYMLNVINLSSWAPLWRGDPGHAPECQRAGFHSAELHKKGILS